MLAPLLAFDRGGRRLGYGAGFYDMTFAALAAAGVRRGGSASASPARRSTSVPADATDVALDLVITETGPSRVRVEAFPDEANAAAGLGARHAAA